MPRPRAICHFSVFVSHHYLSVSNPNTPGNMWNDQHVKQGFAWRPGVVSFATLDDDGTAFVEGVVGKWEMRADTMRCIRVPYVVPEQGAIEITTVANHAYALMDPGRYALTFESGRTSHGDMCIRLTFETDNDAVPKVLLADAELDPPSTLAMTAQSVED